MNYFNLEDDFECVLDLATYSFDNTYSQVINTFSTFTNRETCLAGIDGLFTILDLNNDGYVSRCEDAAFQVAIGSKEEYAFRFSGQFTLSSFRQICMEEFSS